MILQFFYYSIEIYRWKILNYSIDIKNSINFNLKQINIAFKYFIKYIK